MVVEETAKHGKLGSSENGRERDAGEESMR